MFCYAIEYDSQAEVSEQARRLWEKFGVRGEVAIRPLQNGRWLLEVNSERELRTGTIERLGGRVAPAQAG